MLTIRTFTTLLLATVAALAAVSSSFAVDLPGGGGDTNTCRATRAFRESKDKDWNLECEGECPVNPETGVPYDCSEKSASDDAGSYNVCSCFESGKRNNTCCVLILRSSGDSWTLDTKGDCPSCGASGQCQAVEANNGLSAQAVCD